MIDCPVTLADAKRFRYQQWGGNPNGRSYQMGFCAYEVFPNERVALHHQCNRKNGHGPEQLYCAQHAKRVTP